MTYNSSANGNFLIRNQITDSTHSGVRAFGGAINNLISQNAIFDNGPSPIDNIGIDLYTTTDTGDGTPPFVTPNDTGDGDSGANDLLNFPVIERADIVGPNLELSGWARPGSIIEFFVAAPDPREFGEAQSYLTTLTEGSAADTDATVSAYTGLINGIDHGGDTTNRFFFSIPVPAGVVAGTVLTSTATDAFSMRWTPASKPASANWRRRRKPSERARRAFAVRLSGSVWRAINLAISKGYGRRLFPGNF